VPVANPNIDYLDDMLFGPEQSGEEQVDAYIKEIEQEQRNEEMAQPYIDAIPEEDQKKSIKLPEELRLTEEQLDELDNHPLWNEAKQRWKDDHPDQTLKEYKLKYLHGIIDKLPWEQYLVEPQLTNTTSETGYIQNQEQNDGSLWKKIGDK
jgi:hypothetical protein